MNLFARITLLLLVIGGIFVENTIYLYDTKDGLEVEYYDCVLVHSLLYCRRPHQPIDLIRANDTTACQNNSGLLHHFSELQSKNVTVSTILHQWRSSIERVEEYARFRRGASDWDGYVCQCINPSSFGKNCEYQLPMGNTFDQTLQWQLKMRADSPNKVQEYGDVVCYERVGCDSGVLCLDWREICDGVQHCMSGVDEEHCDLLEMNVCDDDEYRCMNGMCVPDQFFLDGEFDCLDWSDELQFKKDQSCYEERASSECDDRVCPPNQWSCGDGQCISDRVAFQKFSLYTTCDSRRDQYFACETHATTILWTMSNGRCYRGRGYDASSVVHDSDEQLCEYLLKCALSLGGEKSCSCYDNSECFDYLVRDCPRSLIQYPRGALAAPAMFFFYNRSRGYIDSLPDFISINGTVRCRNALINVTRTIPFEIDLDARRITENLFCAPTRNKSLKEDFETGQRCHRANESTDQCNEWNSCMSITRLRDGWTNCLNGRDELDQIEMEIERSCTRVRRHRFRCSIEQPTCLSVTTLGNQRVDCHNRFDEEWFGTNRKLSDMRCNDRWKDECSLLRQYLDPSWRSMNKDETRAELRISFHFYCNTFWNLDSREDEDLSECRQWWVCPADKWRCRSGQCIDKEWIRDSEWDCADASDEHALLKNETERILQQALNYDLDSHGYSVPSSCNQTRPFLCPSPRASRERFSCISLDQIGDGHIDCAGAMDEPNTLEHCSRSSEMLGHNFRCASTNTCIPYWLHCWTNTRCPNQSDDEHWCYRPKTTSEEMTSEDIQCFNEEFVKGGRCNRRPECLSGEDEYMCDRPSLSALSSLPYREQKESQTRSAQHTLRLSRYPPDASITLLKADSSFTTPPIENVFNDRPSSSLTPFWCNRGLGVLLSNDSIVCFCPPQYFGDKCQYQTDRVSVLLTLDLSQSRYQSNIDPMIVLKVLVLFVFNNQTLMSHEWNVRPALDSTSSIPKKKITTHFLYSHSSFFRQHRSNLINTHPYSIRIEIYQTRGSEPPTLVAVWRYPIYFDYLPVFRLAKILHLTRSVDHPNPCSSSPCRHEHEECHPLINDHSGFVCLCQSNFTGENCSQEDARCLNGHCASGSLCKSNYRGDDSPLCLCPSDRYGDRCEIEHDGCLSNPCLNNGSCFSASKPDQATCVCPKEFFGSKCQWKKPHLQLSIVDSSSHVGAVLQYLDLDSASLYLILVHQQAVERLPDWIEFYDGQTTLPEIVLTKLYSSHEDSSPELYLLSCHQNAISVDGTTGISEINQCSHLRTFSNVSSPIRYHQLCVTNDSLLCFRDDVYLCICAEKQSRVECFHYDDQLDRCSYCLADGRCLRGDHTRSNDFFCICPPCHSGKQCQFNTRSLLFTLDQLFSADLLSDQKRTTISLLIFFSVLAFFLAIPNNLFTFVTIRRRSCLRHGIGHYLLWMSVINQVSLVFLSARLIHLVTTSTMFPSHPLVGDILCKLFSYFLTCTTRMSSWIPSFVALERVFTTIYLNKQWFKQPRIARCLMLVTFGLILSSAAYELVFVKAFVVNGDDNCAMCVFELPITHGTVWVTIHQIIAATNFLVPLLINIGCTCTIVIMVIKVKMNVQLTKTKANTSIVQNRRDLLRDVLRENSEMITRPAITLVPSIFSLFSLPLLIVSFSLGCQNLESSPLRYLLIVCYFITFIPQILTFCLYIYPSSVYWREWQATTIGQKIAALRHDQPLKTFSTISAIREQRRVHFSTAKRD